MLKKLTTQGNSLALVIDRAIARVLDLNRDSFVRLAVRDKQLTIERAGELEKRQRAVPAKPPVLRPRRREPSTFVFKMLVLEGLEPEMFARIHHSNPPPSFDEWKAIISAIDRGTRVCAPEDLDTMDRCESVWRNHQAGSEWTRAIKAALDEFPLPSPEDCEGSSSEESSSAAS